MLPKKLLQERASSGARLDTKTKRLRPVPMLREREWTRGQSGMTVTRKTIDIAGEASCRRTGNGTEPTTTVMLVAAAGERPCWGAVVEEVEDHRRRIADARTADLQPCQFPVEK
jgi:hypothetical protein